ncbi:MAG TPA: class I SAM-dependent methyltransferase [Anditalea sp.]|nr:class I SAM-dependent methyltransferase [Anditalea sp.]
MDNVKSLILILPILVILYSQVSLAQHAEINKQVQQYLEDHRQTWKDLNVPYEDGQVLHDLIVNNKYQSALEIGTSTGHSTIWIAWALSKTGGKLITIEMDEKRQREARKHLEAVGLTDYVDFRLGNAHDIVRDLDVHLDFVFSDADKDWYVQYFKDIHPNLKRGGTFAAHNVLQNISGISEYMKFVNQHPDYHTTVDKTSNSGIAISIKK